MGASHAPSSVVPSTRLPRLKTVGKGEGGRGEGKGNWLDSWVCQHHLEDSQAIIAAVEFPILLKGACGDHWSGFALLVTV